MLQKLVARLQDEGVHGIGPCSLYMELRDASGNVMALFDEQGNPIEILDA